MGTTVVLPTTTGCIVGRNLTVHDGRHVRVELACDPVVKGARSRPYNGHCRSYNGRGCTIGMAVQWAQLSVQRFVQM